MTRTDSASRFIKATPEAIYAAMTSATALAYWLPPAGMSGEMLEFDPRPGGHYKLVLRYDDESMGGKSGGNQDIVTVRYLDLVPGAVVSQAADFASDDPRLAGTMLLTWTLERRTGGTLVTIKADHVPEGISAEDHAAGLASSLGNLARFTEASAPIPPHLKGQD